MNRAALRARRLERDAELLEDVARGLMNKEIAAKYRIALPTLKNRLSRIFEEIGATNRTEAAAWWWQHHAEHAQQREGA